MILELKYEIRFESIVNIRTCLSMTYDNSKKKRTLLSHLN